MIAFASFALLRPLWLLAAPALFALWRLSRPRAPLGDWPQAIDPPLLDALLRRQGGAGTPQSGAAIFACLGLIALALSGPAIRSDDATPFRNLDVALILLDVSRAEGLPQTLAAAQSVLAGAGARQTGLILYAGDAYLASPLTDDLDALRALLFAVDADTVPDGGARPERALAFARRALRESESYAGDVVLISAGVGAERDAMREAAALAGDGAVLHTLFVAARGSGDASVVTRRAAMAALADAGRGVAGDASRAEDVAAALAARRIEHVAEAQRRALEWRDCGRWLLLAAAAPLLALFRARAS